MSTVRCNRCGAMRRKSNVATCVHCKKRSYCTRKFKNMDQQCLQLNGVPSAEFVCPRCCEKAKIEFKPLLLGKRVSTSSANTVVLCVWYLRAKEREAMGFSLSLEGALAGLDINVITQYEPLDSVYASGSFLQFLNNNPVEGDAALFICIVTEGTTSPGGGLWWVEDGTNQYHETLESLYPACFKGTEEILIPKFYQRTVLQLACGVALNDDGVRHLNEWMYEADVVDEIIAPTNLAFHPAQVITCTVNLATLMYYQGHSLESALPEAWLRDERARLHTDFLLLRSGYEPSAYVWSPFNRPFGCSLPFCDCEHQGKGRWHHNNSKVDETSSKHIYRCKGCMSFLTVQLLRPADFRLVDACGTKYGICPWPVPEVTMIADTSPPQKVTPSVPS